MTYQQCLDYLYSQLPMFQRDGNSAFKKDLTNTRALCAALQQPQEKFKSIHVAGTNGKGSTCHLIAAMLQAEGYKVGLYTSPHYFDFRERIKINGKYIGKQAVVGFMRRMWETVELVQPSFFELTVAMAFDYFARNKVDFAVVETGLGGRLDSTNIIDPLISIITNISFDHQSMLGDTLPLIAGEKAGIIKKGRPIVIGERDQQTDPVFVTKAREVGAPIYFAQDRIILNDLEWHSDHFLADVDLLDTGNIPRLKIGLVGTYQVPNIQTVLVSLDVLCRTSGICLSEQALRYGSAQVTRLTKMQGRWQRLRDEPLIIADSGHNPSGLAITMKQLSKIECSALRIVFGVSKDKDYQDMLALLPKDAHYYWCAAALPRSLPAWELRKTGANYGLEGMAFSSVELAIKTAVKESEKGDVIFIGGSSFVVGESLALAPHF